MCNRSNCGDPDNRKPWCGSCCGHISEVSMSLHQSKNHKPDPTPEPLR